MNNEVIKQINQHLFETLPTWLPNAVKSSQGYQACNPIRGDKDPSSMTIYLNGRAYDFAASKSYDCINLWAAQNGMDNKEAIKFHAEKLGIDKQETFASSKKPRFHLLEKKLNSTQFEKPPKPYPSDAFTHYKYGSPTCVYTYYDSMGELIGYTCRFEMENNSKVVLPFTWSDVAGKNADGSLRKGKLSWHWNANGWKLWPIYGAEKLNLNPHATVLICEGEKTADAAQKLLPDCVVISWAGGVNKASKVDWKILKSRSIIIWPDADLKTNKITGEVLSKHEQPGMKAAIEIAKLLRSEKPKIVLPPAGVEDGWDLADALEEGWTGAKVFEYINRSSFTEEELLEQLEVKKVSSPQTQKIKNAQNNSLIVITHQENFRGEIKAAINVPLTIENYIQEFIVEKFAEQNEFVVFNQELSNEQKDEQRRKAIIAKRSYQIKTKRSLLTQIWCDCDNIIKKSATKEAIENHFENILEKKREQALLSLQDKVCWDGTSFEHALRITTIWFSHALISEKEEFTEHHINIYESQARALLHFIWQVKRKLFGLQPEMHMAPIFLGEQGNGKSEFIRNISRIFAVPFGNFVRDAYVDEIGEEKSEAILASALINILDEMAGASKAEFNKVKNFITRYKVNPREFHSQRTMGEIINLSTFIGAANAHNLSEILHDESGNRRFFPIKVHGFVNKKFNFHGMDHTMIIEKFPWIQKQGECFPYSFDSTPLWKMVDYRWPCFIRTDAVTQIQTEHRYEPLKQWIENFNLQFLSNEEYKANAFKAEKQPDLHLVSVGFLRELFILMYKMSALESKRWNLTRFGTELKKLGIESWIKNERGNFYKCVVCAVSADWAQVEGKIKLPWN